MKKTKQILVVLICCISLQSVDAQLSKLWKKKNAKLDLFEEQPLEFEQYKNHTGEIVFSNEIIFPRELPESKYIKSYNLGDELCLRAFMKNSAANSMMLQFVESGKEIKYVNEGKNTLKYGILIFKMYLDGELINSIGYTRDLDREEFTTLNTRVLTIKDDRDIYYGEELYESLMKKEELLIPGTHKLKIELVPACRRDIWDDFDFKPIATGEIDLVIPEGDSYVKLDECFPKAKMSDSKIEKAISKAVNSNIAANTKLRDVIISSSRWTILRDDYGNPIKKSIRAMMVFTNTKDEVFYSERIFEKVFDGVEYSPIQVSTDINIEGEGMIDISPEFVHSKCTELLKD